MRRLVELLLQAEQHLDSGLPSSRSNAAAAITPVREALYIAENLVPTLVRAIEKFQEAIKAHEIDNHVPLIDHMDNLNVFENMKHAHLIIRETEGRPEDELALINKAIKILKPSNPFLEDANLVKEIQKAVQIPQGENELDVFIGVCQAVQAICKDTSVGKPIETLSGIDPKPIIERSKHNLSHRPVTTARYSLEVVMNENNPDATSVEHRKAFADEFQRALDNGYFEDLRYDALEFKVTWRQELDVAPPNERDED